MWILLSSLLIFIIFIYLFKHYIENGYYLVISRDFAVRRYVFPKSRKICRKIAEDMKEISRKTFDGELLNYPFFKGNYSSLEIRFLCFVYNRKDTAKGPIAVSAPYQCFYNGQQIIQGGLIMVIPEYQRRGIQKLMSIHFLLFALFHVRSTILVNTASSSSFIPVLEKYLCDYYPRVKNPELKPKQWHIDIARFMLLKHGKEFATSTETFLNEDTLVFEKSLQQDGGGAYHLIGTYTSRKSRNAEREEFIRKRLIYENGDQQFFIGRFKVYHIFSILLGLKRE